MRNLIILVLALTMLSSCGENTPSGKDANSGVDRDIDEMTKILTSKKWRFDVPLIKAKFEEYKAKLDPTKQGIVEQTLPRLQFASFEFSTNNVIILDLNNGSAVSTGTWVFTKDSKSLVLTFSSVSAIAHEIIEFGEDQIYLKENQDQGLIYPKIFIPLAEGAGIEASETTKEEAKEKAKRKDNRMKKKK